VRNTTQDGDCAKGKRLEDAIKCRTEEPERAKNRTTTIDDRRSAIDDRRSTIDGQRSTITANKRLSSFVQKSVVHCSPLLDGRARANKEPSTTTTTIDGQRSTINDQRSQRTNGWVRSFGRPSVHCSPFTVRFVLSLFTTNNNDERTNGRTVDERRQQTK